MTSGHRIYTSDSLYTQATSFQSLKGQLPETSFEPKYISCASSVFKFWDNSPPQDNAYYFVIYRSILLKPEHSHVLKCFSLRQATLIFQWFFILEPKVSSELFSHQYFLFKPVANYSIPVLKCSTNASHHRFKTIIPGYGSSVPG